MAVPSAKFVRCLRSCGQEAVEPTELPAALRVPRVLRKFSHGPVLKLIHRNPNPGRVEHTDTASLPFNFRHEHKDSIWG